MLVTFKNELHEANEKLLYNTYSIDITTQYILDKFDKVTM